jgi:hypothetical protein
MKPLKFVLPLVLVTAVSCGIITSQFQSCGTSSEFSPMATDQPDLGATLSGTAWTQNIKLGLSPQIVSYLNPAINSFRLMNMSMAPIANAATVSVATGKIVTNFTITVASTAITSSIPIMCQVSLNVLDQNPMTFVSTFLSDAATAAASRNGSLATCAVTIPYSWPLSYRSTDKVSISWAVIASADSISGANIELCGGQAVHSRCSSQSLGSIAIPANGATTTETVKATI